MSRGLSILMAASVMAATVGATTIPNHPKVLSPGDKSKVEQAYQVGNASWYGKRFHGRTTASGEDFDMLELTAAHRRLPLGSYVKVTNLQNGKWIVVRINDRGPYVGNRIVDLSYGAARMLDFHRGVQKVRLDLLPTETVASADDQPAPQK